VRDQDQDKEIRHESWNSQGGGRNSTARCIESISEVCKSVSYDGDYKSSILARHGCKLATRKQSATGTEGTGGASFRYRLGVPYGGLDHLMPEDFPSELRACLKRHNSAQRADSVGYGEVEGNSGYIRLRFRGGTAKGGGQRQSIKGYSRKSRENLKSELNRVEWKAVENCKVFMVTLTYEGIPTDGREVMRDLDAFRRRLDRWTDERQIDYGAVWIKEFQRRGSVHFHLLVVFSDLLRGDYRFHLRKLIDFVSVAWHEITGSSEKGLRAGTRVEGVKKTAVGYLMRYIGKDYQKNVPEDFQNVGRFWGFWHKEHFAYQYHKVIIDLRSAWRLRRVLCSLLEKKMALRGSTSRVRMRSSRSGVMIYGVDGWSVFKFIDGGDAEGMGVLTAW